MNYFINSNQYDSCKKLSQTAKTWDQSSRSTHPLSSPFGFLWINGIVFVLVMSSLYRASISQQTRESAIKFSLLVTGLTAVVRRVSNIDRSSKNLTRSSKKLTKHEYLSDSSEPRHEKTGFLHMRKQRRRSAAQ